MSRTNTAYDLAFPQDVLSDGFHLHGVWYPIIAGGADDSASDDGGSTEGDNDSDDTGDDSSDDSKDQGEKESKTFTQDEVNKLLARETSKAARGKLDPKELGFQSKAELEDALAKAKDAKEKSKTEAEKAIEEAKKTAADQAKSEVLSKANERLVKAEFKLKAAEKNVRYLDDAYDLVQRLPEWEDVTVNEENGEVEGVSDELLDALEKAKPFLFAEEDEDEDRDIRAGTRSRGKGKDRDVQLREQYPGLRVGH